MPPFQTVLRCKAISYDLRADEASFAVEQYPSVINSSYHIQWQAEYFHQKFQAVFKVVQSVEFKPVLDGKYKELPVILISLGFMRPLQNQHGLVAQGRIDMEGMVYYGETPYAYQAIEPFMITLMQPVEQGYTVNEVQDAGN